MFDVKRILVPIDFAECSERGLELALQVAEKYGAEVKVLHVWSVPPYVSPGVAVSLGAGNIEVLESIAQREAEKSVFATIEKVKRPSGVKISTQILAGIPSEAILEQAEACDLVVMGTHGRKGIAHLFLGSVAEKVIRACSRPVLVTR
jgi:nucleotide-binding universal stress UspA family protein